MMSQRSIYSSYNDAHFSSRSDTLTFELLKHKYKLTTTNLRLDDKIMDEEKQKRIELVCIFINIFILK